MRPWKRILPYVLLFDVGETLYIAVCGNTDCLYSFCRGPAALLRPPFFLDASYSSFPLPNPPPPSLDHSKGFPWRTNIGSSVGCGLLRAPAAVATTRDARASPARTSETLPGRKLQNSEPQEGPPERLSSYHRRSDHRDPTATAAGGGPSGPPLGHPSSILEPRTNLLEEGPRQKSATEAVLPRLSSEKRLPKLCPGSAAHPRRASASSAARLPWDSSHGRDTRGGSPQYDSRSGKDSASNGGCDCDDAPAQAVSPAGVPIARRRWQLRWRRRRGKLHPAALRQLRWKLPRLLPLRHASRASTRCRNDLGILPSSTEVFWIWYLSRDKSSPRTWENGRDHGTRSPEVGRK